MTRRIPLIRRLRYTAADLGRCESGLALTEFAFSLPVLLTLCMAGLETANFAMAHLRVSNVATLAADNAARVRDSIDEADVVQLMTGAKMSAANIDFARNGRIILSDLEAANADGSRQWIRWQRCDGQLNVAPRYGRPLTAGGTAIVNGTEFFRTDRTTTSNNPSSPDQSTMTGMGPANNRVASAPGTAVMVVEVVYRYQPIIPNGLLDNREIRYQTAFNVRQRTDQTLRNAGQITPRSCDTFAA